LPVTIVIAVSNIITQWEQNTAKFTDLRYFTIDNVYSVKKFEKLCKDGTISNYDLIFIKAGKITSNFVIDGETPIGETAKNRSIVEAISRILEGTCIARLLVDDYDTLKLGKKDCFIPAHFTWLISATRRVTSIKCMMHSASITTVEQFFEANMNSNFPILGAALDDVINQTFSLQCSPAYVDEYINSTKVNFRRIEVKSGSFNGILRDLEISDEVIEMINATAIKTATQSLDMNASSVGEVVMRIVGNKLHMLQQSVKILARLNHIAGLIPAVSDETAPIDDAASDETDDAASDAEIDDITDDITDDDADAGADDADAPETATDAQPPRLALVNPDFVKIKEFKSVITNTANDETFNKYLADWMTAYHIPDFENLRRKTVEKRNSHEIMLNRMKDNIREKQCQCCMIPFETEDDAYILAECCQIIVCEMCIIRNKRLINKCPNCLSAITVKGLIRIGSELNIEEALSTDDTILDIDKATPTTENALSYNPKLKALVQYITNEQIDCISSHYVSPYVRGLLDGKHDKPWPDEVPKKFLIFTMFPESTNIIAQELDARGIKYCVMQGTRDQKDECMSRMQRGDASIMLLHSPKNCAGLNMPFISHVVFYHNLLDNEVKSQVAARGQRLGRRYNLEIAEIFNAGEIKHKKK
jgi:hypothetical protein